MIAAVLHHLRIAREFARIGVIRKSQLRVEFVTQVVMDCTWYLSHVMVFEILFGHTQSIAGWSHADIRVLLGFLFISDAFMMVWMDHNWRFGRDLKNGALDPIRVRPAAAVFLYFFQSFSLEGFVNMLMAVSYLGWGIAKAGVALDLRFVLVFPVAVLLAFWARTITIVAFATLEFYLVGSDISNFAARIFDSGMDRPLDIFGRRTRQFLIFVLPIGAMTHFPAQAVLGRIGTLAFLLSTAWIVAVGLLIFALWARGFRRYESALG